MEDNGYRTQDDNPRSVYSPINIIGATIPMTILPIVFVALRFLARSRSRAEIWWDDWMTLFALVLVIAGTIVILLSVTIGELGKHQRLGENKELIHYEGLYNYEKLRYTNELITTLNLGVIKTAILLFYLRLFNVSSFKKGIYSVMALVAAWTFAFELVMILQCQPPQLFWELFEIDYINNSCINVQMFYNALAYSDLILDVIVLVVPFPIVWKLHMPWQKKISVLELLLLGIIVVGSGIARIISFAIVINQTNDDPIAYFHDTTWWTSGPLFWLWCETSVAIIGCCLPTLAPLWNRNSHKTTSRNRSKSSSSKSFQKMSHGNDAWPEVESQRHLVGAGAGAGCGSADVDIGRGDDISLKEMPDKGIRVETSFTTTSRAREDWLEG